MSDIQVHLNPVLEAFELRTFGGPNNPQGFGTPWSWGCMVWKDPLDNRWLTLANGWPFSQTVRAIAEELVARGWEYVLVTRYEDKRRVAYRVDQRGRAEEVTITISPVSR